MAVRDQRQPLHLLLGYDSPVPHLVLGSIDARVALLLAYLLYGRFTPARLLPGWPPAGTMSGISCASTAAPTIPAVFFSVA